MAHKRRFTAAPNDKRCRCDITLNDGSGAWCQRRGVDGGLCRQHAKMRDEGKLRKMASGFYERKD